MADCSGLFDDLITTISDRLKLDAEQQKELEAAVCDVQIAWRGDFVYISLDQRGRNRRDALITKDYHEAMRELAKKYGLASTASVQHAVRSNKRKKTEDKPPQMDFLNNG